MNFIKQKPDQIDAIFVKNIFISEHDETVGKTVLPFFADGYPGLLFHITPGGQWVQPQNKKMPTSYLYGQTLHPVELHIDGAYKIIIFQLYPFVLRSFFGINVSDLNNKCFDLLSLTSWADIEPLLFATHDTKQQIRILMSYLRELFASKKEQLDSIVMEALQIILNSKAQIAVAELSNRLHVTLRTFERRFLKEVGISAKDFMQITRFQQSLEQLTEKDYTTLSDIVYANGYSDQSHFIRVVKAFTGKTPKCFVQT